MEKDFKNILIRILNNFAEDGMGFTNEQNFQFYLGSALKREEIVDDVYFEVFSSIVNTEDYKKVITSKDWKSKLKELYPNLDETHREYTDLVIKIKNGSDKEYIAIELKYKLAGRPTYYKTNRGEFFLSKQGAVVGGAYDFIEDIKRLEDINSREIYVPGDPNAKMTRCFAILLTNNKRYRYSTFKKYERFSLKKDNTLKDTLSTNNKNSKSPISLSGSYKPDWQNYKLKKSDGSYYEDYRCPNKDKEYEPGFSYLVIEVEPKKDVALKL